MKVAVKYPRTPHLPFSPGRPEDSVVSIASYCNKLMGCLQLAKLLIKLCQVCRVMMWCLVVSTWATFPS